MVSSKNDKEEKQMKLEYLRRKNPFTPIIGVARNTESYRFVIQILWLQIGVLKNGS